MFKNLSENVSIKVLNFSWKTITQALYMNKSNKPCCIAGVCFHFGHFLFETNVKNTKEKMLLEGSRNTSHLGA